MMHEDGEVGEDVTPFPDDTLGVMMKIIEMEKSLTHYYGGLFFSSALQFLEREGVV